MLRETLAPVQGVLVVLFPIPVSRSKAGQPAAPGQGLLFNNTGDYTITERSQRTMSLIADQEFWYQGYHHKDKNSKCGLSVYRHAGNNVVIMTELPDNPGTSITNRSELIATEVASDFELDPEKTIWIEHYPDSKVVFCRVTYELNNSTLTKPAWKNMSREYVEKLIGEGIR